MEDILDRFLPLMSEVLHCTGTTEGLSLSLGDISVRLQTLIEEERRLPEHVGEGEGLSLQSEPAGALSTLAGQIGLRKQEEIRPSHQGGMQGVAIRSDLDLARFAVYAWADEQILASNRPDVASWSAMSLQRTFCGTTDAGSRFFDRLDEILTRMGIPCNHQNTAAFPSSSPAGIASPSFDVMGEVSGKGQLSAANVDEYLPIRLKRAAQTAGTLPGMQVLRVYALCLLYGFHGRLCGDEHFFEQIRDACRPLTDPLHDLGKTAVSMEGSPVSSVHTIETVLYFLVPLVTCGLFSLLCIGILASISVSSN